MSFFGFFLHGCFVQLFSLGVCLVFVVYWFVLFLEDARLIIQFFFLLVVSFA